MQRRPEAIRLAWLTGSRRHPAKPFARLSAACVGGDICLSARGVLRAGAAETAQGNVAIDKRLGETENRPEQTSHLKSRPHAAAASLEGSDKPVPVPSVSWSKTPEG
ncbi:hypothetical protein LY78DRAFT_687365 [Colletotrichum sublineola]|nr:hypothetical protein LY78DRAFT_687365 [Colletotrichum sublineola]